MISHEFGCLFPRSRHGLKQIFIKPPANSRPANPATIGDVHGSADLQFFRGPRASEKERGRRHWSSTNAHDLEGVIECGAPSAYLLGPTEGPLHQSIRTVACFTTSSPAPATVCTPPPSPHSTLSRAMESAKRNVQPGTNLGSSASAHLTGSRLAASNGFIVKLYR